MKRFLFTPESISALSARLPPILEEVYDVESILLGVWESPMNLRRHLFDFYCGIRLIISRDRWLDGGVSVHVRGGLVDSVDRCAMQLPSCHTVVMMEYCYRELGNESTLHFFGIDDHGLLHMREE